MPTLAVAIFSYNRGSSLKHCVSSVQRLTQPDVPLAIFDDGSDDKPTVAALESIQRHPGVYVFSPHCSRRLTADTGRGGLYANMNQALAWASGLAAEFVLFLQDDVQIIRTVTEEDIEHVRLFFSDNPNALQLLPFFSPFHELDPPGIWVVDPSGTALQPVALPGRHLSDVGIYHVERATTRLGGFEGSERQNGLKAGKLGLWRGIYRWPFAMFMPFPRTHGNRSLRRLSRLPLIEALARSGLHPYRDMSESKIRELFSFQATSTLPARDWLDCPSMNGRRYWSFYGGTRDLRASGRFRGLLGAALGGSLQLRRNSMNSDALPDTGTG